MASPPRRRQWRRGRTEGRTCGSRYSIFGLPWACLPRAARTGCQIIIGDGLRGNDDVEVPVAGAEHIQTAKIGKAIMEADVILSLSHFKGHEQTRKARLPGSPKCILMAVSFPSKSISPIPAVRMSRSSFCSRFLPGLHRRSEK